MKQILTTFLAGFIYLASFAQCAIKEVPLTQRAAASTTIVEGQVISKNSFWNSNSSMIYTSNIIQVYKIFKGSLSLTSVEIITEGGTVGMNQIHVEPSLELNVGDVGVFTCEPVTHATFLPTGTNSIPRFEAYASSQGFLKYNLEEQTASDPFRTYADIANEVYSVVLSPTMSNYQIVAPFNIHQTNHSQYNPNNIATAPTISSFSPTTITAGTGTTLTINGNNFGTTQGTGTVGFKNADDGGSTYINPLATQIVSWSNTQILVKVPSNAGTGTIQVTQAGTGTSSTSLTISYAELNVDFDPGSGMQAYQTDHVNDNGTGGYTWQMNTAFDAATTEKAAFMRAFDTWRCNTGVNWAIGSTTSINSAAADGTNVICNDNSSPLPAGVLGRCTSYWSGCASGPTIVWYVNELDIVFDEGSNLTSLGCTWDYGPALPTASEYDFETVAVHELGHGHQLAHVILNGQIMHYAISNGASHRSLSPNDLAAATDVQSRSTVANACGPGAMTNYSCGSPPVAAFSGTPTTLCAGGSVAFTDQSTNTPTSWSWTFTGGTPGTSTSQNPTITYSTPGTYAVSLTATNASGSDNQTANGYITVNANPNATASSQTNISCNGGSNGSAVVSVSGGTSPYTYAWTPSGGTAITASGLSAGTYTCTVSDSHSCTDTQSFTITQPTVITASASHTNVSCNAGTNGSASVVASGGTPSYTYSWSPSGGTAATASGLSSGNYTCTITDANSCSITKTFSITQPTVLTATQSQINISCNGGSNGSASVVASGGTPSYTYAWSPSGGTAATASGLAIGNYTCTITDANGCSTTKTFSITQPSAISSSLVSQTNISCNGGSNGAATISASGGTGSLSYNWTPGNPTGDGTVSVSGLTSGTWTCTITDANGCTTTQTVAITQPSAITSSGSSAPSSCSGNTGSATATASGGTGSLTYSWAPTGGTSATAINLAAGSYTCTITDANSCTITQTVTVGNLSGPSASVSSQSNVTCNAACNGVASVTASGGAGGYTYAWTPSGGTSASANSLCAGTYTCTVTDAASCTAIATVSITEPAALIVSASNNSPVCTGSSATLTGSSAGGTGAVTFNWMPGNLNGASVSVSPLSTTTYTVTGTDANGCSNFSTTTVTVNPLPTLTITSNPSNGIVCSGSQATLTASGANTYSWTGGITNGVAFTPTVTTTYTVTGTSSVGCQNTAASTITVNNCSTTTTTVPCGNTYSKKTNAVSAGNVAGATSYRFSFYDNSTGTLISQYSQASRTLTLTSVAGLYYNTTYKWTVAVNTGSGFGPESNSNCTITFGIPSTVLPCGANYTSFSGYTAVTSPGGISNYRFTIYDNSTGAIVTQRTQTSNYLYFNTLSGLYYGTTYKWTVACEYPTPTGTAFGPESSNTCTVTFAPPVTTVPCGNTYVRASSYTTAIAVSGSIGYRFSFYQGSALMGQRVQPSNYIYFNQVAGLAANQSYTWTVEVQYNSSSGPAYGPPSNPACTITFGPGSIIVNDNNNNQSNLRLDLISADDSDVTSSVLVFPNPTSGIATIDGNGLLIDQLIITDISGRIVYQSEPKNSICQVDLKNEEDGIYFITVIINDSKKVVKIIKHD